MANMVIDLSRIGNIYPFPASYSIITRRVIIVTIVRPGPDMGWRRAAQSVNTAGTGGYSQTTEIPEENSEMQLNDMSLFRQQCYIDGAWADADDGATIEVTNPATGETLGTVPKMGANETRRAIEAANAAWPAWRAKTAKERSSILRRWFELMLENKDDLAVLMTTEQGKPLAEALGEAVYGASFFEWFAEEGRRAYGDVIPTHMADRRIVVLKEPVGVCAAITPWNFPSAMITRKAGPALAAGCPMVVKPASATPYSALALAELAERAGVPKGVFSVVTGAAGAIGGEMTSNPIVRKLTFTGSTEVGKILMRQCAGTVKKVSMELGGNAPFIVFDDADIDAAVEGAMVSKYRNAGQTCVCANRLLVQDSVYEEFAGKLAEAVSGLKVGSGLDEGVNQGPLIDMSAVEKVEQHIADATAKGARIVVGGGRHEMGGTFFQPTILADVTTDMAVTREETFGPLAPLFRFKTEEEAIAMANDTEFGLAAYFYSRDMGRVWRVSEGLEYGIVGANVGIISTEVAPFGGMKESGIGREGSHYGLDEFMEVKYICMGGVGG
jgi:succinate-semialdehyde dehydrogenase/glutarate-semialdehyde dehydrogenase